MQSKRGDNTTDLIKLKLNSGLEGLHNIYIVFKRQCHHLFFFLPNNNEQARPALKANLTSSEVPLQPQSSSDSYFSTIAHSISIRFYFSSNPLEVRFNTKVVLTLEGQFNFISSPTAASKWILILHSSQNYISAVRHSKISL